MTVIMRVRSTISYGAGGPGLVTHYFLPATTGGSTTDATNAVAGVRAFWLALASLMPTSSSALVQPAVDTIQDTSGALVGGLSGTPVGIVPGTATAPFHPVMVALVIRYRTAGIVANRRVEGRSFVSPLASAPAGSTSPSVGAGTAAQNAVAALLATTTAAPLVWSRPKVGPGARSGSSYTVVSGDAWSQFGSLRSRRD